MARKSTQQPTMTEAEKAVQPLAGMEPVAEKPSDWSAQSDTDKILVLARERASEAWSGWKHNFELAENDLDFLDGDQWDEEAKKARKGRPMLTINELPQHVDQIEGDMLQRRPRIKVRPVQGDSATDARMVNVAGSKDYSMSEIYDGIIRNIWQVSKAASHVDRAGRHAVESGFGWLRVLTEWSKHDIFAQDITVRSVRNRFSVLMDPMAQEPDFSDARYCFIFSDLRRREFEARYPAASEGELAQLDVDTQTFWQPDNDTVRVAEYYWREPYKETYLLMSNGMVIELSKSKAVIDELTQSGITEVRRRDVTQWRVMWAKITGESILEAARPVACSTIPVVPVLGKELTKRKETIFRGAIRYAKDPQRMENYWLSAMTERVALAPKRKWVAHEDAIEGYEDEWTYANVSNDAVLRVKSGKELPTETIPPSIPAAELQVALTFTDKIKATTGIYDASLGNRSNETSGVAIQSRQQQGDRGSFAYPDNQAKAVERIGTILLEMIPQVYDTERQVRIMGEDMETTDQILINTVVIDQQTGHEVIINDISQGKYDAVVDIGPDSKTARMDTVAELSALIGQIGNGLPPAVASLMAFIIVKNMDVSGIDEVIKAFRKQLVQQGAIEPEQGDQPPQPSPEQQMAAMQMEVDKAKAEAEMAKAQATQFEAQAKMAELQMQQAMMHAGSALPEAIREMVADALAEFFDQQSGGQSSKPKQ